MMSAPTSKVTVYNYWVINGSSSRSEMSTAKATLEKIRDDLGTAPVMGTGHEVDKAELDTEGFFRRVPTGWAALLTQPSGASQGASCA
jgi:hypothetical protein